MDNKTNELGYKNHDPFFYNLNKNFQTLMGVVADTRRDLTQLEILYVNIDTFYIFYSSYVKENKEEIEKKLKSLKEYVYSKEFNRMITSKKATKVFFSESSKKILDCLDVIPLIMTELHRNNLFPHLIEVDKSIPSAVKNIR